MDMYFFDEIHGIIKEATVAAMELIKRAKEPTRSLESKSCGVKLS
jgi:hypothetical protein